MSFSNKIVTYLFLIALVVMSMPLQAREKRALVIGLGKQEDKNWAKINGDKDIFLVKKMLSDAGFGEVHTLVNENATKANIVGAFNTIIDRSGAGDVVYIHFSGHGQQMTDFDHDEDDDWDECWIPYDAYLKCCARDDGSRHLTDDEINAMLYRLRAKVGFKGKILVVVDACHSGDSSRGDKETYRGTRDVFHAEKTAYDGTETSSPENWIIVSACRDYQRNAELKTDEGQYGKLTYALYTLLRQKHGVTNYQLYKELCRFFDKNRGALQQTPVMKGLITHFNITDVL